VPHFSIFAAKLHDLSEMVGKICRRRIKNARVLWQGDEYETTLMHFLRVFFYQTSDHLHPNKEKDQTNSHQEHACDQSSIMFYTMPIITLQTFERDGHPDYHT
jgi:hypothetical protein